MRAIRVGVVGPGDVAEDSPEYLTARDVGRRLAQAGAVTYCGGLGGVMAAVARGVAEADPPGTCIGLLPGPTDEGAGEHLTHVVVTGMGEMRNALLVRTSQVVVVVGGSWGTLSEVAFAVRTGRPVIGLLTWQLATAGGEAVDGVHRVTTAEDAVRLALALAAPSAPRQDLLQSADGGAIRA